MRVLTVLGTRPEIIRLSRIVKQLESHCEHVLVYTGQNFVHSLRDVFFEELGYREPDLDFEIEETSFARQASRIIAEIDMALIRFKPDRVLVLGDTNSGLAALPAARRRVPVFHLEAGNRCYDDRVPEELNRRVIDHCSSVLLPYTHRSKENLLREGISRHRIFVVGNPINEVLNFYKAQISQSTVVEDLGLKTGSYLLASMHRSENVDDHARLRQLLTGLSTAARRHHTTVVMSLHPRTANRLSDFDMDSTEFEGVRFVEPFGFFDWIRLEESALCVVTDSGTVQEECCILRIPNVTIRDVTERPETLEVGSNMLTGAAPDEIANAIDLVVSQTNQWITPAEYDVLNVSETVSRIVLGYGPTMGSAYL
jgi:UDP-N-acetylglucosamine 2-epimerase (non-hydrolysing)